MMRTTRRGVLAGLGATLALPGILRAEEALPPPAATLARAATPPRDASGLIMKDGEGAALALADFAGKIVVLNLWGPWCVPCRREMPSLARLATTLDPARGVVLPLAFDWRGASAVRRFYRETDITNLPVLTGDGDNLKAVLGLENLPTTAIIDRTGRMIEYVEGEARWDDPTTIEWLLGLA